MEISLDQAADIETSGSDEAYRFNDELLLTKKDRGEAQKIFPTVYHVLDHLELRRLFEDFDEPANAAKARSRTFGLLAIGLASFALLAASAEPLYGDLPDKVPGRSAFSLRRLGSLL